MSTLSDFLDGLRPRLADGGERIGARQLHEEYVAFADARDEGYLPEKRFIERVTEEGFVLRPDSKGDRWTKPSGPPATEDDLDEWIADRTNVAALPDGSASLADGTQLAVLDLSNYQSRQAPATRLRDRYVADMKALGKDPLDDKAFAQALKDRGISQKREGAGLRWLGISVQSHDELLGLVRKTAAQSSHWPAGWGRHDAASQSASSEAWREHFASHDLTTCGKDHALPDDILASVTAAAAWRDEHCHPTDHCPFTLSCEADIEARFRDLCSDSTADDDAVGGYGAHANDLRLKSRERREVW